MDKLAQRSLKTMAYKLVNMACDEIRDELGRLAYGATTLQSVELVREKLLQRASHMVDAWIKKNV